MSKNKKSFLDSPKFIKAIEYVVIVCTLILGFMFMRTGDPSLLPYILSGIGALIAPFLVAGIKAYLIKEKRRAEEEKARKDKLESARIKREQSDRDFDAEKVLGKGAGGAKRSTPQE